MYSNWSCRMTMTSWRRKRQLVEQLKTLADMNWAVYWFMILMRGWRDALRFLTIKQQTRPKESILIFFSARKKCTMLTAYSHRRQGKETLQLKLTNSYTRIYLNSQSKETTMKPNIQCMFPSSTTYWSLTLALKVEILEKQRKWTTLNITFGLRMISIPKATLNGTTSKLYTDKIREPKSSLTFKT